MTKYKFRVYSIQNTIELPVEDVEESVSSGKADQDKVKSIMKAMQEGKTMEPIVVRKEDNKYKVTDGNHRLLAHKRLGKKTIEATKTSVERTGLF